MTDAVKPNWKTMDVATLGAKAEALWQAKRDADKMARTAREAFETHVLGLVTIPEGKRLAMAYNFGKFSVALVADDGKARASKPSATPLTLKQALGL